MSSKDSLGVYWGGFLYNGCSPTEVALNYCSHSCNFCFANLNKPDRTTNAVQIFNLLSELWQQKEGKWKRTSYAAHLLREGYAVTISNHVDLLAASNWFQAKPLMVTLVEMGIPVTLLTRFGKSEWVAELLDILEGKPTAFYCSITTLDEAIASRCEPGAPLPGERLEFIRQVIGRGHKVTVGINPIVPGWINDPAVFCSQLKAAGVWGVWLNKIHLSQRQIANMSDREKEAFGADNLAVALRPNKHPQVQETYDALKSAAKTAGLEVYTGQQGDRSDYFKWEKQLVPKSFPLMQDFVNWAHDNLKEGDAIYWETFRDFFVPQLPKGTWGLRDHLNAAVVQQALYGLHIPQRLTYEQLLWHCWRHKETLFCPANVDCFAWAADPIPGKSGWFDRIEDDDGNPILIFQPGGTDGYAYTDRRRL